MEACPFREGSKRCIWWLTGCTHPEPLPGIISPEDWKHINVACSHCNGCLPRKELVHEEKH